VRSQENCRRDVKTIHKWPVNEYIFDWARIWWRVRFKLRGKAGQTIRLRHAEVLKPDGVLYVENLRRPQTDYYTFKSDETEEWEPRFTFHGFRYVEISGLSEAPPLMPSRALF
jgi:hypothetical protein